MNNRSFKTKEEKARIVMESIKLKNCYSFCCGRSKIKDSILNDDIK